MRFAVVFLGLYMRVGIHNAEPMLALAHLRTARGGLLVGEIQRRTGRAKHPQQNNVNAAVRAARGRVARDTHIATPGLVPWLGPRGDATL